MRRIRLWLPVLPIVLLLLTACGQSAASLNNQGNQAYQTEQYDEALENYTSAQLEAPDLPEPYYNSGNTHYRKGDLESAVPQLQQSLRTAAEELSQNSFYNLGNTYFQAQDWPAAIAAYEEALRINPDDVDAKHNLELALQQMQQQMQQQQQQQGGEGEQQQQQQGGEGEQQQQNQQGNQNQQGQGDQEDQNDSGGGQQDQEQDPDQQQNGPSGLSKEEAEQLLDALGQNNQTLQERLQEDFQAPGPPPAQDW